MRISQLLANRYPHASASAVKQDNPTALVVKNEERSSWKKPVYYTALAVAGIGVALFFAYNSGIFSPLSSAPPPSPQPSPSPPHQPSPTPTSTPMQEDVLRNLIQTVRQEAQDPQKSEAEKAEIIEIAKLAEQFLKLPALADILKQPANLNLIERKDCPDIQTVCPVPNRLCNRLISDEGIYTSWDCSPINSYITKLLKEDCPTFSLFPVFPLANETSCDY